MDAMFAFMRWIGGMKTPKGVRIFTKKGRG